VSRVVIQRCCPSTTDESCELIANMLGRHSVADTLYIYTNMSKYRPECWCVAISAVIIALPLICSHSPRTVIIYGDQGWAERQRYSFARNEPLYRMRSFVDMFKIHYTVMHKVSLDHVKVPDNNHSATSRTQRRMANDQPITPPLSKPSSKASKCIWSN